MDSLHSILNNLLVDTYNEITKIEERSVKLATGDTLSITEMHTLEAIGTGSPRMMSEVAGILKISVSTLTIAVGRLVKKGYVERYRTEEDRRVVKVLLTEKAKTVLEAHRRFHDRMIDSIVDRLSPEEQQLFSESIRRLLQFFKEENERISQCDLPSLPETTQEEPNLLRYQVVEE